MANPNWIGGAAAVAQVNTITITNVASTNTFTITIGTASITVTAGGGDTVTTIAAALVALATAANAPPQFLEASWANVAGVITMTQKAANAGQPIVQTSSATGGSAAATTATTTASSGPNNWGVAANWSTGVVPVASDTVTITGTGSDILYGLDQHTITVSVLLVNSKTIKIGLPEINAAGYPEYRPTSLKISATTLTILQASGRVKIDTGTNQTTAICEASQNSIDNAAGIPAVLLLGTHASNALYLNGGSVGIAFFGGATAQYATVAHTGGTFFGGSGLTLATYENSGGTATTNASVTTVKMDPGAGTLDMLGAGANVTTMNVYDGTLSYQGGGTITTLNCGLKGKVKFTDQILARTVTNCTLYAGATITDTSHTVTFTNAFALAGCRLSDITLDFGVGRSFTIAA